MPFKVQRTNQKKNERVTSPATFATTDDAFDAACDNLNSFLKASNRSANLGNHDGPPAADWRYKVWVVTKKDQRNYGLEIVYDFPTNDPADESHTNRIMWRIVAA